MNLCAWDRLEFDVSMRGEADESQPLESLNGENLIKTQRNFFEILLNQPEIRLFLPCSD